MGKHVKVLGMFETGCLLTSERILSVVDLGVWRTGQYGEEWMEGDGGDLNWESAFFFCVRKGRGGAEEEGC